MAYSVPPLPYAYDALEPSIDKATMEVHHDKHHQAYVDKVNAALEGTPLADAAIEDVLRDLSAVPEGKRAAVRNNGGGHYNHTLFWESMSPDGGGEPSGELAQAIDSAFGSFADFQAKLKETGVNQFGSGWSWLVHDGSGLASSARPTRTPRCRTARRRCSASTCGSTPTTSSTRTADPTTSTRGGTSSTGAASPSASAPPPRRMRGPAGGARAACATGAGPPDRGRFGLLAPQRAR